MVADNYLKMRWIEELLSRIFRTSNGEILVYTRRTSYTLFSNSGTESKDFILLSVGQTNNIYYIVVNLRVARL